MPKMVNMSFSDSSQTPAVTHTFEPVDRFSDTGIAKWEDFGSGSVPGLRDSLTVGVKPSANAKDRRATTVLRVKNGSVCVDGCTSKTATKPVTFSLNGDIDNTASEGEVKTALLLLIEALKRPDVQQAICLGVPFVL